MQTFHGAGRISAPGKVEVTLAAGGIETIEAKNIVVATGSDVARLPGIVIDEERVVSSTGAIALKSVPSTKPTVILLVKNEATMPIESIAKPQSK